MCTDFIIQVPAPSENRLLYYALAAGYFISILSYTFPCRNRMHRRTRKSLSGKSANRLERRRDGEAPNINMSSENRNSGWRITFDNFISRSRFESDESLVEGTRLSLWCCSVWEIPQDMQLNLKKKNGMENKYLSFFSFKKFFYRPLFYCFDFIVPPRASCFLLLLISLLLFYSLFICSLTVISSSVTCRALWTTIICLKAAVRVYF